MYPPRRPPRRRPTYLTQDAPGRERMVYPTTPPPYDPHRPRAASAPPHPSPFLPITRGLSFLPARPRAQSGTLTPNRTHFASRPTTPTSTSPTAPSFLDGFTGCVGGGGGDGVWGVLGNLFKLPRPAAVPAVRRFAPLRAVRVRQIGEVKGLDKYGRARHKWMNGRPLWEVQREERMTEEQLERSRKYRLLWVVRDDPGNPVWFRGTCAATNPLPVVVGEDGVVEVEEEDGEGGGDGGELGAGETAGVVEDVRAPFPGDGGSADGQKGLAAVDGAKSVGSAASASAASEGDAVPAQVVDMSSASSEGPVVSASEPTTSESTDVVEAGPAFSANVSASTAEPVVPEPADVVETGPACSASVSASPAEPTTSESPEVVKTGPAISASVSASTAEPVLPEPADAANTSAPSSAGSELTASSPAATRTARIPADLSRYKPDPTPCCSFGLTIPRPRRLSALGITKTFEVTIETREKTPEEAAWNRRKRLELMPWEA